MARQTPVLLKSFMGDSQFASANVCVVASTANAGNVMLPATSGDVGFIGVLQESVPASSVSDGVDVMVAGIAQIKSDGSGTITAGKYVQIADSAGQIKQTGTLAFAGSSVVQIVGIALNSVAATAGLLCDVLLQPMLHKP